MKVAFFDTHAFEKPIIEQTNQAFKHSITYLDTRLTEKTAALAKGHDCVCAFVNDRLNKETLNILHEQGTRLIALRSAGYNHVDIKAAAELGLKVVRVPGYSPYAVAEHAVALILTLNRKTHRAINRVHEGNFSLNGMVGFDLHGKTVGVVGTGKIGAVFCRIMHGFGCHVLAHDSQINKSLLDENLCRYVPFKQLLAQSDIISLHVPLTPKTHHMINQETISSMKPGVMLINTGRGALIDSKALIQALKSEHVGYAGLDVYEEEEGIFFEDLSDQVLQDDTLARLLTFPHVVLTSHQAFLTKEALGNIAQITLQNIADYESGEKLINEVSL